eukprot:CAMPEP_0173327980 /NCGR_PEP_ID=MMETSP1144-20121109/1908_1 /TAXON_ID=483371 /ORGANISM="non described non described, Strain CCMP2298" /LENGTH=136 /DNA_ID=CAMNT_0014272433 /DNA_START=456 /DNA_END=863 /DNA_ORIENTATION=-
MAPQFSRLRETQSRGLRSERRSASETKIQPDTCTRSTSTGPLAFRLYALPPVPPDPPLPTPLRILPPLSSAALSSASPAEPASGGAGSLGVDTCTSPAVLPLRASPAFVYILTRRSLTGTGFWGSEALEALEATCR